MKTLATRSAEVLRMIRKCKGRVPAAWIQAVPQRNATIYRMLVEGRLRRVGMVPMEEVWTLEEVKGRT